MEAERTKRNEEFNRFATHPLTSSMVQLHTALKGDASTASVVLPDLTASEASRYLDLIASLTVTGGWAIAAEDADRNTREGEARRVYAAYLYVYTKAYFRNGQFAQVKFDLADFYKRNSELEKYKAQLDPILKSIGDFRPFGKVGDSAFVSRVGRQLQFSPLEITVDPTKHTVVTISKVDFGEVGADLVRVALEAVFDAQDRLPAVANASGAKKDAFEEAEGGYVLPEFKAVDKPMQGQLSSEQFTQTATYANSGEGAAASATAQAIRGLNIAALNNEALAKAIEALVGTTVRKVTEKVTYCWYACVVNGTHTKALAAPGGPISPWLPSDSTAKVTLQFR